jgi:hypothetical protein
MLLYQKRNSFPGAQRTSLLYAPLQLIARRHCCCTEVLSARVLGHRQVGGVGREH